MTPKEYANTAIDTVIDLASEQGIKYRRGDFGVPELDESFLGPDYDDYKELNLVGFIGDVQNCSGITVTLSYTFARTGKKLKANRDGFYEYKYCIVREKEIFFRFSMDDLELLNEKKLPGKRKTDEIIKSAYKLLADPEHAGETEAISTSIMAQKLLTEYIPGKENPGKLEQAPAETVPGKKWKYSLANMIATNCRCKCYYQENEIVFWGYLNDILISRMMFLYLFKAGNRLATKHIKDCREYGEWKTAGMYERFCNGFCERVGAELEKNRAALKLLTPQEVIEEFEVFSSDLPGTCSCIESAAGCPAGNEKEFNSEKYKAKEAEILSRLTKEALANGKSLTYMHKFFFLRLLDYAEKNGEDTGAGLSVSLSVTELSQVLKIPLKTVSYSLKNLLSCGVLYRVDGEKTFPRSPSMTIINKKIYEKENEI